MTSHNPQQPSPFGILRPRSWAEAKSIGAHLTYWAFRGHSVADWSLDSVLERLARQTGMPADWQFGRESWIRTQFQRRAHHYQTDLPPADCLLEWLALIQHHGGPTRALDFTASFYIGAFFACETGVGDAAIWAVNRTALMAALVKVLGIAENRKETVHDLNAKYIAAAERFLRIESSDRLVLLVEPERLNERMSIQQGLFLVPASAEAPLAEQLCATFGHAPDVLATLTEVPLDGFDIAKAGAFSALKIVLPASVRGDVVNELSSMNVTAATLFPGLDGFARSLHWHVTALTTILKRTRADTSAQISSPAG